MVGRLVEIPLAADRPMRARTKGNWEAGARGRRRTPWTAPALSRQRGRRGGAVAQMAREVDAGVAEIASAIAAFRVVHCEVRYGRVERGQLDRAEPTQEQAVR